MASAMETLRLDRPLARALILCRQYTWRLAMFFRSHRFAAGVVLTAVVLAGNLEAQEPPVHQEAPSAALVHLRAVDASILQDIRYAGPNNFTGRPVAGYAAPECLLLRDVAEALARVQNGLRQRKLSLKVMTAIGRGGRCARSGIGCRNPRSIPCSSASIRIWIRAS